MSACSTCSLPCTRLSTADRSQAPKLYTVLAPSPFLSFSTVTYTKQASNPKLGTMLLTKRLPESAIGSRQPHQVRSVLAACCSPQQQWARHTRHFDRTIACVQRPQQEQQQLAADAVQQECASTSAVQHPLPAPQAAGHSKAAAAAYLVLKLQQKWQQLALWCKQHRVQQLLWG